MKLNIRSLRTICGRSQSPSLDLLDPSFIKNNELYQQSIKFGQEQINDLLKRKSLIRGGKDVIIVGAGFSGLMCGWLLQKLGFNVKILEARPRIGGRVYTLIDDGHILEAGGEHIGLNHPLFLFLCNYFGFNLQLSSELSPNMELDKLNNIVTINNQRIFLSEITNLEQEINDTLMKISLDAEKITYPSRPWLDRNKIRAWDKISLKDKLDEWGIFGKVRKILEMQFENDNVGPISKQSYLGLLCQIKGTKHINTKLFWDVVELVKCSEGNQNIASCMANGLEIILDFPVRNIEYQNGKIKVGTNDSKWFECDNIVLTVPPPIWSDIYFSPKIDIEIYKPLMGSAVKMLSTFSQPNNKNHNTVFVGGSDTCRDKINKYILKEDNNNNNNNNLDTENILLVDWPNEQYTKTGYSFPAVGNGLTVNKLLYYPVPQFGNKLYFAGEHTQINFAGFIEGALQSGFRVAEQIFYANTINWKRI